jgi:hypothetical protein
MTATTLSDLEMNTLTQLLTVYRPLEKKELAAYCSQKTGKEVKPEEWTEAQLLAAAQELAQGLQLEAVRKVCKELPWGDSLESYLRTATAEQIAALKANPLAKRELFVELLRRKGHVVRGNLKVAETIDYAVEAARGREIPAAALKKAAAAAVKAEPVKCAGLTGKKQACKNAAVKDSRFCSRHAGQAAQASQA